MLQRERGFTLIEILVVITIIAALVGMVTVVIPKATAAREKNACMRNLQQIGGILVAEKAGKGWKWYSGAAFLLQVADQVKNEDLEVFLCPGEKPSVDDIRPEEGSSDFVQMYRKMNLREGVEDRYTSFAGPNWKDYPERKAGKEALESRIIGCDKCRNGEPHHNGIVVMYDSSKVDFLGLSDLEGHDEATGEIIVGKDSGDKRLAKMCFFPPQ